MPTASAYVLGLFWFRLCSTWREGKERGKVELCRGEVRGDNCRCLHREGERFFFLFLSFFLFYGQQEVLVWRGLMLRFLHMSW